MKKNYRFLCPKCNEKMEYISGKFETWMPYNIHQCCDCEIAFIITSVHPFTPDENGKYHLEKGEPCNYGSGEDEILIDV